MKINENDEIIKDSEGIRRVVVCVRGCGGARPADSRSESVSHVDERNDDNNVAGDVLVITCSGVDGDESFRYS